MDKKQIWKLFKRVLVIISWGFWIGLLGYIGGSYISNLWAIVLASLGAVLGGLWGIKSRWFIC